MHQSLPSDDKLAVKPSSTRCKQIDRSLFSPANLGIYFYQLTTESVPRRTRGSMLWLMSKEDQLDTIRIEYNDRINYRFDLVPWLLALFFLNKTFLTRHMIQRHIRPQSTRKFLVDSSEESFHQSETDGRWAVQNAKRRWRYMFSLDVLPL